MKGRGDWRLFRKNLLGISLIVAPLLLLIATAATSSFREDDPARYLSNIADNSGVYYAGNIVGMIGGMFAVGAVLALVHLVRVRRPLFAVLAGGLALAGTVMMPGVWGAITVIEYQMAQQADRSAFVALLEGLEESATIIPLFVTWIGTAVGMVLLAGGLWLARSVPRWIPLLLGVAFVASFAASTPVLSVIASALVLVALGAIGVRVLQSSVDDWETGDLRLPAATTAEPPSSVSVTQ